jgi:hypothetical protein
VGGHHPSPGTSDCSSQRMKKREFTISYENSTSMRLLTAHFLSITTDLVNTPTIDRVPLYEKDKYLKSRTACNKFIRGAGKATPGLFLVFCKEHGKLIGFHAMKYSESERTVHNLLFSRFPEAPEIIIYDNCCNLHGYVLSRQAAYYKDTLFVIDRLHENSHGSYSPAYSSDKYIELRHTNTQIAEQKNSLYVQKRAQLYAMGHFMFLFHLRYYTWACARRSRIVDMHGSVAGKEKKVRTEC